MKVKLIAKTCLDDDAVEGLGYLTSFQSGEGNWESDADELAEFAGRNCYRSFNRPNPATASNEDYLKHILDVGHESVLEHASATFYIEASRSVLTELERHRHLSFSVVSQRYVSSGPLGYWIPPLLKDNPRLKGILYDANHNALEAYATIRVALEDQGVPRKQAREAARAVLPNMTNSPMVVTGNHRAWRDVLKKRWHEAADAEIRELAGELLRQLREIAPNTYQDIPDEPYSY